MSEDIKAVQLEVLRRQYNVAIANGLGLLAWRIDRQMKAIERTPDE